VIIKVDLVNNEWCLGCPYYIRPFTYCQKFMEELHMLLQDKRKNPIEK